MHSGGAKYDQTYYSNRRYQVQSYRRILTIDPVQELPVEIGAKILRQLSFKQRTSVTQCNQSIEQFRFIMPVAACNNA
ncbi:hypothetical protein LOAG_03197 [Loa loa]|uniref:F-box domain-containing protein n=1 Tax=Loa loa TaxID=7209 RepID=A0A1S0U518_LOALO|nr:hypothetical protein LOAG_03197 [Loa loa]EFO25293.1 hypothetical protein LOAG_03197 [Loa loa]